MANCPNCEKPVLHVKSSQVAPLYCSQECKDEWRAINREGSFSKGWQELSEVTEARTARNAIFEKLKPLACAGDRIAKRFLRQTMRLRAIWDDTNKKEVRL